MDQPTEGENVILQLDPYTQEALAAAVARPTRTRLITLGQAVVDLEAAQRPLPRGVTSHSSSESAVYKEEPFVTRSWNHALEQHAGEPHDGPACKALTAAGGITYEESTSAAAE